MSEWTQLSKVDRLELWHRPADPDAVPGPPILAVHGLEDGWRTWTALTGLLPGHPVYALHLPWHAGNDYRWRAEADAVTWLRRALELLPEPPAILLGHSFGGTTILHHLTELGGRATEQGIIATVLLAPFYRPPTYELTPAIRERSWAAFRRVIVGGLEQSLGRRAATMDPDIRAAMTAKLVQRAVPAGFPAFMDLFESSGTLELSRITVPALVLTGIEDLGLTPARAAALDRAMPAATVRSRADYSHFCHVGQAGQVAAEADGFLRSLPGTASEHSDGGPAVTALLDGEPTSYVGMPRFEGANIRTWIGFKHFLYLVEEAVHQYFRDRGVGASMMYRNYGLGLAIVDCSAQLPGWMEADEHVHATVVSAQPKPGQGAPFTVRLEVEREDGPKTVLKGKVRVALIRAKDVQAAEPVPEFLEPYVVPDIAALAGKDAGGITVPEDRTVDRLLVPEGSVAHLWQWRAPYYWCQFSDRLQHSAFVRALEEVVDRYLQERGLGIGKLLTERGWIPVVSKVRVQLLSDVYMDEIVHTVFEVDEVLRDTMYTARMDNYVRRGDRLELVATGTIMHGYSLSRGERAGHVATLDPETQATLLGSTP